MENRDWKFDYLKAIGIVCVVIMHIWITGYDTKSLLGIIFPFLFSAVIPMFMIISGYFYVSSWEKNQLGSIGRYFQWSNMSRKLKRILIPYLLVYGIEVIVMRTIFRWEWLDWKQVIYWGIQGGFGPGSYYVPVLLQLIFCFPFLYWLFRKDPLWGSVGILAFQTIIEAGCHVFEISSDLYRLMAFRYFVFLWAGMVLYHYRARLKPLWLALSAVIGAAYICILNYSDYAPHFYRYWTDCSLPTVLYFFPLSFGGLCLVKRAPNEVDRLISTVGESTFSIFLVQMLFYQLKVNEILPNAVFIQIVFNVFVCVSLGCFFQKMVVDRIRFKKRIL